MPAAKSPRSTPAVPHAHWRPPPPARAQPGRHDRRRPEGRQSLSRPRPPAGHTALDRHASPNPPPAPHARPSAPCCLHEVTHTYDRDPQSVAARPNQRAPVVLSFLSHVLPPHSGDENDTCRPRHEPWPTLERPLPRQKTHDARRLAGHTARARRRGRLSRELHALPDRVSVATGLGDGRGRHDRWLEAAVTGNARGYSNCRNTHLCSFGRGALTRSASADLHCHPAGADRQSTARPDRAERSEPQSGARDDRGAEDTRTELSGALLTRRTDRPGAACSAGSRLGVVTIGTR